MVERKAPTLRPNLTSFVSLLLSNQPSIKSSLTEKVCSLLRQHRDSRSPLWWDTVFRLKQIYQTRATRKILERLVFRSEHDNIGEKFGVWWKQTEQKRQTKQTGLTLYKLLYTLACTRSTWVDQANQYIYLLVCHKLHKTDPIAFIGAKFEPWFWVLNPCSKQTKSNTIRPQD